MPAPLQRRPAWRRPRPGGPPRGRPWSRCGSRAARGRWPDRWGRGTPPWRRARNGRRRSPAIPNWRDGPRRSMPGLPSSRRRQKVVDAVDLRAARDGAVRIEIEQRPRCGYSAAGAAEIVPGPARDGPRPRLRLLREGRADIGERGPVGWQQRPDPARRARRRERPSARGRSARAKREDARARAPTMHGLERGAARRTSVSRQEVRVSRGGATG